MTDTMTLASAQRPSKITVTTLPAHRVTTWDYPKILSALDAHERGEFSQSSALADAFGRDDRINACMTTRVIAITGKNGADFSIEPSEYGSKSAAKVLAKLVTAWWYKTVPERTLKRIFRDVLLMGVSVSRQEWVRNGSEWIPKLTPWPMRDVWWDEQKRCFIAQAVEGIFEVRRGDPNWLIVAADDEEPWMAGLVRCLALPFLLRTFSARDWARFCERHGLPIVLIKEPMQFDADARKSFANSIKTMGRNGVVRLPQQEAQDGKEGPGFNLEFLEAKDTGWASFEAFRKDLSTSIAISVLGQNLTTEVNGGSLAAIKMHDAVRREYRDADVEVLSTELHDGTVVPYVRFHRPNDVDAAPWPKWETSEPEDQNKIVETANKAAAAIQAFKNAGLRVDVAAFVESVGIPMLPGDPIEEPEPEPDTGVEDPDRNEPDPDAPDDEEEPAETSVKLASGDAPADAKGFVAGQAFADRLADAGAKAAKKALAPSLESLLAMIDKAESFDDVRSALAETYANMNTDALADLMERVEILAQLAGRAAVLEDL
jgi:phage gp29-like protein